MKAANLLDLLEDTSSQGLPRHAPAPYGTESLIMWVTTTFLRVEGLVHVLLSRPVGGLSISELDARTKIAFFLQENQAVMTKQ